MSKDSTVATLLKIKVFFDKDDTHIMQKNLSKLLSKKVEKNLSIDHDDH